MAAAQKEAEVGSIRSLLEAVGPDLTLGELIELTDNPSALLQIRCAFLSSVIGTKTDEPIYGEGKKRKKPGPKRRASAGNGKAELPLVPVAPPQTSLPIVEPKPPPRPEAITDDSTDGKRDERVLGMIADGGDDGIGSEPILKDLGCTKAQLRYSIRRLRKAEKIESRGEKRARRHFAVETEPSQEPAPEGA